MHGRLSDDGDRTLGQPGESDGSARVEAPQAERPAPAGELGADLAGNGAPAAPPTDAPGFVDYDALAAEHRGVSLPDDAVDPWPVVEETPVEPQPGALVGEEIEAFPGGKPMAQRDRGTLPTMAGLPNDVLAEFGLVSAYFSASPASAPYGTSDEWYAAYISARDELMVHRGLPRSMFGEQRNNAAMWILAAEAGSVDRDRLTRAAPWN